MLCGQLASFALLCKYQIQSYLAYQHCPEYLTVHFSDLRKLGIRAYISCLRHDISYLVFCFVLIRSERIDLIHTQITQGWLLLVI